MGLLLLLLPLLLLLLLFQIDMAKGANFKHILCIFLSASLISCISSFFFISSSSLFFLSFSSSPLSSFAFFFSGLSIPSFLVSCVCVCVCVLKLLFIASAIKCP